MKKKALLLFVGLSLAFFSVGCDLFGGSIKVHNPPMQTIDLSEYLKDHSTSLDTSTTTTPAVIQKSQEQLLIENTYMKKLSISIADGVVTSIQLDAKTNIMKTIQDIQDERAKYTPHSQNALSDLLKIIAPVAMAKQMLNSYYATIENCIKEIYLTGKLSSASLSKVQSTIKTIAEQEAIITKVKQDLDAYINANP